MSASKTTPFILVDGSSYLYRAFHALPPLTNSAGEPTGAVYGVINMLKKLISEYSPEHMVVVFDAKGKTFRDELYPDYKANRSAMPDDLVAQVAPLHALINALGIPLLIVEGVEADDVIGTLAEKAASQNIETLISTGDKDMAQLVNPHVMLVNTMTNAYYDRDGVIKKFDLPPESIVDYLTLIGDPVDNVPGIPGVGPKTAAKWLKKYGSLDEIIAHADDIKGKVGESLRAHLSHLPLSKQLITIKKDVALTQSPEDFKFTPEDQTRLIELYTQLEFRKWLNERLQHSEENKPQTHYTTLLTQGAWQAWCDKLAKAPLFALDTETTHLDHMRAELVGLSFAITPHEAVYVPIGHDYLDAPEQLSREEVLEALKPLLLDKTKTIIGQNLKYDLSLLNQAGLEINAKLFDTMLESYVLNSASSRHNMDALALKYLGHRTIHYEDVAGKGAKQIPFNQVPLETATPYAAEDADITLQLHHALWPKLSEVPALVEVFENIEMPLVPVLAKMERNGVLIDAEMLQAQSRELATSIKKLEDTAHQLAGAVFNLGSTKQLKEILYEKLNLPILSKTPKGAPSTAESALQTLALDYPLPKVILDYRSLSKLKSTYTDSLPNEINPKTGHVHTSYNQAVTATGRLSSTSPNLQNIPARSEEGRRIRRAFIAPPGYKIIASDYSQIELRIMAHLTQDEGLMRAFAEGHDIHRATASEVFGVSIPEVTSDQRRSAKAINFGLIYGMSAFGLAKQLGVAREDAQAYIDVYFHRYPGIKNYMEKTREIAHEKKYVETIFGRRLYLPEINAQNMQRRRAAERAAINAPMQGSAADIIKVAMINIHHWLAQTDLDVKMIMQVHDELVFEAHTKDAEAAVKKIRTLMCEAVPLNVPVEVDVGVADNWSEAHS